MKIKNIEFLKLQEGTVKNKAGDHIAYRDSGGVWTIGYGHTKGVKQGDVVNDYGALKFLAEDLAWAEAAVNKALDGYKLTQNQFDSLVSLTYNIGATGFAGSTVVKRIKAGDNIGAAEALTWWNQDNGSVVPGLVSRRAREKALFLTPDDPLLPLPTPDEKKTKELRIRALVEKFVKDIMEI
jgi:lysozyme